MQPAIPSLPHRWHGQGRPLLLVSGLGCPGTSWKPFLLRAAERWRVLSFDAAGSGDGPPLAPGSGIRQFAESVLRLLDDLGLERLPLVGRSLGGMVAQELALLAPERLSHLVLVSTTGRTDAHLREIFRLWAQMAELGVSAKLRHRSGLLWCLGREALERDDRIRAYLAARARLATIPGAGHLPYLEAPGHFAERVLGFLDEHRVEAA